MYKQYIKQALQMLKEAPLVSAVSITGTSLAIAMAMVVVILFQIEVANYKPETKRDRTLYVVNIKTEPREGVEGLSSNTVVSLKLLKDYLYNMQTPERVAAYTNQQKANLFTPTKTLYMEFNTKGTDANFWQFFDFRLLDGRYPTEEEFQSGLPVAVISKSVAQLLFMDNPPVGNTVNIDMKPYRIVGVVDNVSKAANSAYADVWIPLTSNREYLLSINDDTGGNLMACLLARSKKEKKLVAEEFQRVIKQFSDNSVSYVVSGTTAGRVDMSFGSYWEPGAKRTYFTRATFFILFLLLLPAINLTGITMNNIRQRSSEIGIRKTFGANKANLMWQILMENLVITAIGAVIGYLLSFLFVYIGKGFLITSDTLLTADMLINPYSFLAVVVFSLIMNILSAGIPAWRIANSSVVNSLSGNES